MADPIQQQIVDAIDTRFKTILTTNGYGTNVGQHVTWWKESPVALSDLPGMNLKDPEETRIPGCGIYERSLILRIEASVSGSDSPETARLIEADIEKAIFIDNRWGGLASNTEISGSGKEAAQKQNKISKVTLSMEILYETKRGDPYTRGF